ncbi:MAG: M28 family peptidase [Candidatus Latescibacteria bacterium]|nr:M28 family peptidase [Candidatus Latescibacterota bacterium]
MASKYPRSLQTLCRQTLPLILRATKGRGMVEAIAEIVATDRWNSFDKFHQTTQTLVRRYQQAGAQVEVYPVQTGGRLHSGRWIIREAADVGGATVDVVAPLKQRLLDYGDNPWHAVQWTAATPKEGVSTELVVLDTADEIDRLPTDGLAGKTLLTSLNIRAHMELIADKGATVVMSDIPVAGLPDAVAWTKFGWGGVPMGHATARLVGLVLSQRQGEKLRRLARRHDNVVLHTKVDVRKYVGTHDVVCGLVRGATKPQEEIWVTAHSNEPGAIDNASGVAVTLEVARVLETLIAAGKIPRPQRTIRLLNAYECYGFFPYLERAGLPQPLAGLNVDSVGARPDVCDGRLEWHSTIPMSARFVDWIGEAILRATLRRYNPGYKLLLEPFRSTADTLIGDPQYGYPCPWITTHKKGQAFDAYHTSADTLKLISPGGMKTCAASTIAYLLYIANLDGTAVAQTARTETDRLLGQLDVGRKKLPATQVDYVRQVHRTSMDQLGRFAEGVDLNGHLKEVQAAAAKVGRKEKKQRIAALARRVPRRTAPITPSSESTPPEISRRIGRTRLSPWTLFWADGKRTLAEIARLAAWEECDGRYTSMEKGYREVDLEQVIDFFEAHAALGYVEFCGRAAPGYLSEPERIYRGAGLKQRRP